jgi:hypothetical protein
MKRAQWLAKRGHACETIHAQAGDFPFYAIIHDVKGRQAEGWGSSEERAFEAAHLAYLAQRRRAAHSEMRAHYTEALAGEG